MVQSALGNVRSQVTARWDIAGLDTDRLWTLATQRIAQSKAELVLASRTHGGSQKQGQNLAVVVPQSVSGRPSIVARKHQMVVIGDINAAQHHITVWC